jgi:hypothetical protein
MVVAAAQVGHKLTYTWSSPLVEGTNAYASSSAHSGADFAVTGDPGTVIASATCSNPNRQALVAAVLQPQTQSSGEGVIPQMLVQYMFDEDSPTPELKGHWKLDDNGSGGAIAIHDDVVLKNNSDIDGYRGQSGAYGGANKNQPVTLVTNTSNDSSIDINHSAKIWGSTYNSPGANPTQVVSISSGAEITGNRYEQSVAFNLSSVSAPSGMPSSQGNKTYNSGNYTINTDTKFDDLTIKNGATISIQGDVRIQVADDFEMKGGTIQLQDANASLKLYVDDEFKVENSSVINPDTTAAARMEIYVYDSSTDVKLYDSASISGIIRCNDEMKMYDQSTVYGAVYVRDNLKMEDDAAVHIDLDLPGYHIVPVADDVGTNPGLTHGGVEFAQSGAQSFTDEALHFDGSNDFVVIPHHNDYLLSNATIGFWFKSESLSGDHTLFSKDSSNYDTGGHLNIYTDDSTLKARIQTDGSSPYGSGDSFEVTTGGLSTNTWYHVALTIGAGGIRLYLDGSLVDSDTYPGGLGASSGGLGNFEPLVLGAGTTGSGDLTHLSLNDHFEGWMDDVRIYQEVLDAGQVSKLKQGQNIGDRSDASYIVRDTSGLGTPLDLTIDNTDNVAWPSGGGLTINQGVVLRASEPPSKIRNGATATGEFSIEFIATSSNIDATQRRMFWYGPSSGNDTNLELRQQSDTHVARVRSSDTADSPPSVTSATGVQQDTQCHLLLTYDGEYVRIYRDGALVAETGQTGNLLNWDTDYNLVVANLPLGNAPWLGTLHRLTVYDLAMNQQQTDNLVGGLPPGDGVSVGAGGTTVVWQEMQ